MDEITLTVPDMSCSHCEHTVGTALERVAGVVSVDVDLETKRVTVRGDSLVEARLRAVIDEAGYEAS